MLHRASLNGTECVVNNNNLRPSASQAKINNNVHRGKHIKVPQRACGNEESSSQPGGEEVRWKKRVYTALFLTSGGNRGEEADKGAARLVRKSGGQWRERCHRLVSVHAGES
ncbi:hypothetical protein MRX96_000378 [Rhipicephalus microplus]